MVHRIITEAEARAVLASEEADRLPFQFVNAIGVAEIHSFLAERHKKGGDHFTANMLRAWAGEAEFQLGEGNPPTIELKSWDTVSGHTETFTVSAAGVEWAIDD